MDNLSLEESLKELADFFRDYIRLTQGFRDSEDEETDDL